MLQAILLTLLFVSACGGPSRSDGPPAVSGPGGQPASQGDSGPEPSTPPPGTPPSSTPPPGTPPSSTPPPGTPPSSTPPPGTPPSSTPPSSTPDAGGSPTAGAPGSSIDGTTPLTILGDQCVGWWDRHLSTLGMAGGRVESVEDLSGHGATLLQANAARQPAIDGDFIVHANTEINSDDILRATNLAVGQGDQVTFWMLGGSTTASPAKATGFVWSASNTAGTSGNFQLIYDASQYGPLATLHSSSGGQVAHLEDEVSEVPDTNLHLWIQHLGDGVHTFEDYNVGTWSRARPGAVGSGATAERLSIGASAAYDALSFPLRWRAVVIARGAITTEQRAAVTGYLAALGDL